MISSHGFQIFSLTHAEANHHSKTRSQFESAALLAVGRVTFHSLSVSSVSSAVVHPFAFNVKVLVLGFGESFKQRTEYPNARPLLR